MDKSMLGLLGGASALALLGGGSALSAPSPAGGASDLPPATSYAELLNPIPNAVNTLQALQEKGSEPLQLAQVVIGVPQVHHHHHHHHPRFFVRQHHHHHHHHHNNAIVIPVPGPGNG